MPKPLVVTAAAIFIGLGFGQAANPDPKVLTYSLPDQIKWTGMPGQSQQAILAGDPSKPELYVMLVKWYPHHMSRPHFHPNERYITVLSGTWWVGTGSKYDPDSTYPMKAGSFVTDLAKQIHYDGAKDEECVLEIVGMGPATSTGAEK
jgi:quercetin dioxygenase-like cupin family protein